MTYWLWFALSGVFVIVEVLSPTFYFLWLAFGAFAVGVMMAALPTTPFWVQLLVFGAITLAAAMLWRSHLKKYPQKSNDPLLNARAKQMLGKTGIVVEAIQNGRGRVKIGDSTWIATGADLPVNKAVKVVAIDGAALKVEAQN